ncbi:MAG TPA: prepilin-type N-terminal cleavage/methylation domain-containing protein [Planctomycetota bacterium]|nr:prepilin-type N-terminal cleavage/methylation domain-containing protein [Planctomycetota bacterium]
MTRRDGGFTLLEMVVATAIFAAIAAAAFALFDASRGLASKAEMRARLFQTARAALKAIEDDVRGAAASDSVFHVEGFFGEDGGTEERPADRLELVAVQSVSPTRTIADAEDAKKFRGGDLTRVIYRVEADPRAKARGLVREKSGVLTPPAAREVDPEAVEAVAPDVVGLDVAYEEAGAWRTSWDSLLSLTFPRSLEVTVHVRGEWRGQEVVEAFRTRFTLPLLAEAPAEEDR